jgi:anti-sigma factor RsiW
MDCVVVDLAAYHFGTLEEADRDGVEEHLLGCTSCLRAYLALKRRTAAGAEGAAPSAAAREKLRSAVAARFRPTPWTRARAWMARPIPLYQGLAAAVLALVVASLLPALAEKAPEPLSGRYVDSARPLAESITIY